VTLLSECAVQITFHRGAIVYDAAYSVNLDLQMLFSVTFNK